MFDIIDTFYDYIIKEAARGDVDCFFRYNLLFSTEIPEMGISIKAVEKDNSFVPTLFIKNKAEFDRLLYQYINIASKFYDDSNFAPELSNNNLGLGINKEKLLAVLLWSNATMEDFQNPCEFLKRRISFFKNTDLNEYINSIDSLMSECLNSTIKLEVVKSKVQSETPYRLKITLHDLNSEDCYHFPDIFFGIEDSKAYVLGIQTDRHDKNDNCYYVKRIKRLLYGIDEGLDVKNENFDNYDFGNIKDVTASFVVAANIFTGIIRNYGITQVIVPSILIVRWNAKEITHKNIIKYKNLTSVEADDLANKHEEIQNNLTEKLLRTFNRLAYHHTGFNITSYAGEIDEASHFEILPTDECNNALLRETSFKITKKYARNRG